MSDLQKRQTKSTSSSDLSIFDDSDGSNLCEYLRRKRGIQNKPLFANIRQERINDTDCGVRFIPRNEQNETRNSLCRNKEITPTPRAGLNLDATDNISDNIALQNGKGNLLLANEACNKNEHENGKFMPKKHPSFLKKLMRTFGTSFFFDPKSASTPKCAPIAVSPPTPLRTSSINRSEHQKNFIENTDKERIDSLNVNTIYKNSDNPTNGKFTLSLQNNNNHNLVRLEKYKSRHSKKDGSPLTTDDKVIVPSNLSSRIDEIQEINKNNELDQILEDEEKEGDNEDPPNQNKENMVTLNQSVQRPIQKNNTNLQIEAIDETVITNRTEAIYNLYPEVVLSVDDSLLRASSSKGQNSADENQSENTEKEHATSNQDNRNEIISKETLQNSQHETQKENHFERIISQDILPEFGLNINQKSIHGNNLATLSRTNAEHDTFQKNKSVIDESDNQNRLSEIIGQNLIQTINILKKKNIISPDFKVPKQPRRKKKREQMDEALKSYIEINESVKKTNTIPLGTSKRKLFSKNNSEFIESDTINSTHKTIGSNEPSTQMSKIVPVSITACRVEIERLDLENIDKNLKTLKHKERTNSGKSRAITQMNSENDIFIDDVDQPNILPSLSLITTSNVKDITNRGGQKEKKKFKKNTVCVQKENMNVLESNGIRRSTRNKRVPGAYWCNSSPRRNVNYKPDYNDRIPTFYKRNKNHNQKQTKKASSKSQSQHTYKELVESQPQTEAIASISELQPITETIETPELGDPEPELDSEPEPEPDPVPEPPLEKSKNTKSSKHQKHNKKSKISKNVSESLQQSDKISDLFYNLKNNTELEIMPDNEKQLSKRVKVHDEVLLEVSVQPASCNDPEILKSPGKRQPCPVKTPPISKKKRQEQNKNNVIHQGYENNTSGIDTNSNASIKNNDISQFSWLNKMLHEQSATNHMIGMTFHEIGFVLDKRSASEMQVNKVDGITYFNYLSVTDIGYMRFAPLAQKQKSRLKKFQMKFIVLNGSLTIYLDRSKFELHDGDFILLPIGTSYYLRNYRNEPALLMYVKNTKSLS